MFNLYDLLYWHTRDKAVKEAPLQSHQERARRLGKTGAEIEKNLTDNAKLIADADNAIIGTEPSKVVFDVFLKARADAPGDRATGRPRRMENVDRQEIHGVLQVRHGLPDDCCGPDVGEWSIRQRLVGPQPYLIDPNQYLPLICCLVEKRYGPAQKALTSGRRGRGVRKSRRIKRDKDARRQRLQEFRQRREGRHSDSVLVAATRYWTNQRRTSRKRADLNQENHHA